MTTKITSSSDGTKVTIGTAAEDALQIDSTAKTIKALAPYNLVAGKSVAQSWQNVTASRGYLTDYTNDTGQPIHLSIILTSTPGVNLAGNINVGGVTIENMFVPSAAPGTYSFTMRVVVPAGAVYQVNAAGAASVIWFELR